MTDDPIWWELPLSRAITQRGAEWAKRASARRHGEANPPLRRMRRSYLTDLAEAVGRTNQHAAEALMRSALGAAPVSSSTEAAIRATLDRPGAVDPLAAILAHDPDYVSCSEAAEILCCEPGAARRTLQRAGIRSAYYVWTGAGPAARYNRRAVEGLAARMRERDGD